MNTTESTSNLSPKPLTPSHNVVAVVELGG